MKRLGVAVLIFLTSAYTLVAGIDDRVYVKAGGIDQYLWIKGKSAELPVLLFLHGGPGNSVMGYADKFCHRLYDNFVVVHWDQRNSGKTLSKNTSSAPTTVDQMEADAVEIIQYLRQRFKCEKIFLAGHSWGGFLGLVVAWRHSELLSAYVAICPMVNQMESERRSLDEMKARATREGNHKAMAELDQVMIPYPSGKELYLDRKWISLMEGRTPSFSQGYVEKWALMWLQLFNDASAMNLALLAPEIKCPIYFFVGRKDQQTHSVITADYFEQLKAPRKALFWFENSGHLLNLNEPDKLQTLILEQVLPQNR